MTLEILFGSKESESYRNPPYDYRGYQVLLNILACTDKLIVLAALIFTTRLFQLVSNSRNVVLHAQMIVPSETWVILITFVVCNFGFLITLHNHRLLQDISL